MISICVVFHSARLYLSDVLDDDNLELVAVGLECLAQVCRLALRADRATDRVALLKQGLHDPNGDIAVCAGNENFARIDGRHELFADLMCVGTVEVAMNVWCV